MVRNAPEFRAFFARLLGRLSMLAWFHHGIALLEESDKHALLSRAAEVRIASEQLVWDDWSRFSGRQQAWMKFGGLLGEITYAGDLAPFLPYLILGGVVSCGGENQFWIGAVSNKRLRIGPMIYEKFLVVIETQRVKEYLFSSAVLPIGLI
ncbi:MAG: hypothetical protein HC808_17430 [Candidatus Competibacteraceae bacterium]|nr:hypothetical protein [Candidatus Competibacteraceae bacterium]